MSLRCTVCLHAARAEIDAGLVLGQSHRTIAARYRLSKTAVTRHTAHAKAVTRTIAKVEAAHERTVLERVRELQAHAQRSLQVGLDRAAKLLLPAMDPLDSMREMGRLLELEAKLTGAFAPKVVKHVEARDMTVEEQIADLAKLEREVAEERARLEAGRNIQ